MKNSEMLTFCSTLLYIDLKLSKSSTKRNCLCMAPKVRLLFPYMFYGICTAIVTEEKQDRLFECLMPYFLANYCSIYGLLYLVIELPCDTIQHQFNPLASFICNSCIIEDAQRRCAEAKGKSFISLSLDHPNVLTMY